MLFERSGRVLHLRRHSELDSKSTDGYFENLWFCDELAVLVVKWAHFRAKTGGFVN